MNKKFLVASFLVINAFSWYFPLNVFFSNTIYGLQLNYQQTVLAFGFHYLAILLFAIVSTSLINRKILSRNLLLSLWMLLGVLLSASMVLLTAGDAPKAYLLSFLLGMSLGFGFPACLAFFSDSVNMERRGSLGGITIFLAFLGIFMIGLITSSLDFVGSVLVLVLWRAIGLFSFQISRPGKTAAQDVSDASYKLILSEKPFILYIIPWLMFSLVNFFHQPLQQFYWGTERSTMITVLEFGIGSIAALVGGHISDRVGRKRLIILGYVLLGIGYAMLSIFPTNDISISTYVVFDGVAWGLFALIFFTVIWGELAGRRAKDRYYLLGELPFLISSFVSVVVCPYISVIPMSASFSLSSFFLFLAVLPLVYAPETLPEKRIKDMEIRSYLEKAKKVKEKFT